MVDPITGLRYELQWVCEYVPDPTPTPQPTPIQTPAPPPHRIRVQLQRSRNGQTANTWGSVVERLRPITTKEVREEMGMLWLDFNSGLIDWAPRSITSDLVSALITLSEELQRFPPYGVIMENFNFLTSPAGRASGYDYRVDLENMKGWNLRE